MTTLMSDVPASEITKCGTRSIRKPCKGCGRTSDLWWGHYQRGNGNDHNFCKKHSIMTSFILIEADGSKHVCAGQSTDGPEPDDDSTSEVMPQAPKPEVKPATHYANRTPEERREAWNAGPSVTPDTTEIAGLLAQLFANSVSPDKVNALFDVRWEERAGLFMSDMVEANAQVIRERLDALSVPTRVEISRHGEVSKPVTGLIHEAMPKVLRKINAYRRASKKGHVMMVGPAGTGKTEIGAQIAEALDLPFYPVQCGPTMMESRLLGYNAADGYRPSPDFRPAVEHGGVLLMDEVDNSNGSVLNIMNAAMANGVMSFPDGKVNVHPDLIVLAGANTYGNGPDRAYVGRQALDKAFLDRFSMCDVNYDEALERAICESTGASTRTIDEVLRYCRAIRRNIFREKMPVVVGMRASIGACCEISGGCDVADVVYDRVRHGMSDQDWSKVTAGVSQLSL